VDSFNISTEVTNPYSLRGRVFNKIREDILKGRYRHNESLKETKISKELGVSRTPVREAIRQLELEGLIKIIPNKGAVVSGINSKDIQDIYAIRSLIEGLSAKWACQNITDSDIEELEEIIYLSEFHLSKGHIEQIYILDNKFHEMLYNLSNSKILKHVLSDFHHYVQRVRLGSLSATDRAKQSIQEHKDILQAIKEKDAEKVEALTNKHVRNTIANVNNKNIINELHLDD